MMSELSQAKDSRELPTANDVERFTEGDCHFLARALSVKTGWPLMAFCFGKKPDLHAFVLMPDLRVLDVEGPCSIVVFKRRWKAKRVAEFDWATLRGHFLRPSFGDYTYRRAQIVADRLLNLPEVRAARSVRPKGANS